MDFIIGDHTAVEMKTKVNVSPPDTRARRAQAEEKPRWRWRYLCVRLEPRPVRVDGVEILRGRQAPKSFLDSKGNQEDPSGPKPMFD